MGRKRKSDKHLAPRVYYRSGAYYYAARTADPRKSKWHWLAKTYPEALRALATLVKADGPPLTLEALIARYDVQVLSKQAPRTQLNRRQQFKQIRDVFGKVHPNDITTADVFQFWESRGCIPQAKKEISALSAVLSYGRKVGAVNHDNPCFDMDLPARPDGQRSRARYVTDDEFVFARSLAPPMIGYAMDLALIAGLDGATIRRLERRHITDDGLRFERGKTGTDQLIEWNDDLRAVIDALKREPPQLRRFLVCSVKGKGKGGPLSLDGFQTAWQRLMDKVQAAGREPFAFHNLRGKSGSDAASDEEAQHRLGHKSVETTRKHYRHLPVHGRPLTLKR